MEDSEALLHAAEDVLGLLQKHGIDAVVIGAVALAAYHYVRQTEDIDLGVNAELSGLRALAASLTSAGYSVEFREPDAQDRRKVAIHLTRAGIALREKLLPEAQAVLEEAMAGMTEAERAMLLKLLRKILLRR
jgi:hypothetical protein